MIGLSLKLKESTGEVEDKLLRVYKSKLNAALRLASPVIRRRVGQVCQELIRRTDEYLSLINGELMGELGIPDAEARMDRILATIARSVEVAVIPVTVQNGKLTGGLLIKMIRSDFEDILQLSGASYVSQPSGETVPWLEWLIGSGDQIVVFTHKIIKDLSDAQKDRSRTGKALMIPGSGWRVPPQYSGTFQDNFILRAFSVVEVERVLSQIIEEEIKRRI